MSIASKCASTARRRTTGKLKANIGDTGTIRKHLYCAKPPEGAAQALRMRGDDMKLTVSQFCALFAVSYLFMLILYLCAKGGGY